MQKDSTHYKKIADELFSKLIRARGFCERCNRSEFIVPLDCAHIIGRSNLALRWNANNALPLCRDCHRFAHEHPKQFLTWFASRFLDRYDYIQKHRNDNWQLKWYDYEELIAYFKQLCERKTVSIPLG